MWPWEAFNRGVFWAVTAAGIVLGVLYFVFVLIAGMMDS